MPLLRVRRRAFTLDGVPIEASDDRYLALLGDDGAGQCVTNLFAGWGGRAVGACGDFLGEGAVLAMN